MAKQMRTALRSTGDPSQQNLQSLNAYSCAGDNPILNKDSNGKCFEDGCVIESLSAIGGAIGVGDMKGQVGCSSNVTDQAAAVGDSITIFGYPNPRNLLGISETVTQGMISGILPRPIYKTTAAIDHGNSGGLAVLNKSGCALGIPTFGASGLTSGIGYVQSYLLAGKATGVGA